MTAFRALPALLLLAAALPAAEAPAPFVADGPRAVADLAGTWQAHPAAIDLAWPPPADGWQPHPVPHRSSPLIASDRGVYFPFEVAQVVDGEGRPAARDGQAAWFRRTLDLSGPVPAGMRALLRLDGVAWRHAARVNGAEVGGSVLGLVPHVHDITGRLQVGGNQIAIGAAGRAALWDQERRTFVAPIAGVMPGIFDQVRIELVPELRLDDAFVRTAVGDRRIDVDLVLVNAGAVPRTVVPRVTVIDPEGVAQTAFAGAPVTVAAGATAAATLGTAWLARHLWSPGTPSMHRAEVRLEDGGALVDRLAVPFGFREFAVKGRDFQLNGRRQVLLRGSWIGDRDPGMGRDEVLGFLRDAALDYNCLRLHTNFNNPYAIDQADRSGMLLIPEFSSWYRKDDRPFPIAQAAAWAPNTAETMRRLVRRWRNHPSIVLWSLANETMWDSTAPARMAVAETLVRAVRAEDPTRPLQGDAEITWGGRLDAISIHYPEGDAGTAGKRYENSGWVVPNDLAWLQPEGRSRAWRADFAWDRPLMIGELYAPDGDEPERYTAYAGDAVYDRPAWTLGDFYGRDDVATRMSPWIEMVKMSCDHYRAAGVACLNPWTGRGAQTMPALLVAPLDHFPNAFAGEPCERRLLVANDHHQSWPGMHVQASLVVDGRTVWSEPGIPADCAPGAAQRLAITIRPPPVDAPVRARLVVRLRWLRGASPRELHRHEEDLWISPRPRLDGVDPGRVALVDGDGATRAALAGLGLELVPGPGDDAALAGRRLLVIGEESAAGADLAAAARFAERGGRVLVLHQRAIDGFIPAQPGIDPRHAASFSWRKAVHPALAGLDDGQLRFWRPDHLVASESLVRPSAGAAVPVAASGGRYGMHWSPLAEVRHGRGAVTFCQYLLAGRAAVEPAAARILAQAVRAGADAEPAEPAPALRLIGAGAEARAVLAASHVLTVDGPDGDGPALVDAARPPTPELARRLRAEVEAGRVLWLRGLDASTLPGVQGLLPWTPAFVPLARDANGAVLRGGHPLADGLGSGDLYWARGPMDWDRGLGGGGRPTIPLGGPAVAAPALDRAVLLTEPALLVAAPLGRGWVLIDQLGWDRGLAAETERVTRIAACLARNAGAGFRAPAEAARRWRFAAVDLAPFANRGYADEQAGDGRGGWTDQGDNDLRYFLINHTGLAGGNAVAVEPFPASVRLQGVDYRLADPQANHGLGVIVLRAGGHDPAAPAAVRGIPAGGARADRLWFLHAAAWASAGGHGTEVARYEIVYADGSRAAIPVRIGVEVNDWWDPRPLSGAVVAWSGRNDRAPLIGVYAMPWDNPHPERPIQAIDVVGDLAQTQLALLGITLAVEEGGARPAAAWDLGRFADGAAPALAGGQPLAGAGVAASAGGRLGLRLAGGQHLAGRLPATPLAAGAPVAIEVEVAPAGRPGGAWGGLVEVGRYQACGLRILLGADLRVAVEHWAGPGAGNATVLKSREPLPVGRLSCVRYEHDGRAARLLVDGQVQAVQPCLPAAPYDGGIRIGLAAGSGYWFDGVVAGVRILAPGSAER